MLLVNEPVPVPFVVLELETVGLWLVLQHIPLAVTAAPPSLVIFPPPVAVVEVIEEAAVVVRVGSTAKVVKLTWLP